MHLGRTRYKYRTTLYGVRQESAVKCYGNNQCNALSSHRGESGVTSQSNPMAATSHDSKDGSIHVTEDEKVFRCHIPRWWKWSKWPDWISERVCCNTPWCYDIFAKLRLLFSYFLQLTGTADTVVRTYSSHNMKYPFAEAIYVAALSALWTKTLIPRGKEG